MALYPVRCQNHVNDKNLARFNDHLERFNSSDITLNPQQVLQLQIVYVVIPLSAAGNISVQNIQAQHSVLNKYFYMYNGGLPSNLSHYPYAQSFGNPYIQFLPENANDVTEASGSVIRLNTPRSPPKDGYSDPDQCQREFEAQGQTVQPGVMYVYLTALASSGGGTLLGQAADILANYAMIHFGTVGSQSVPGYFSTIQSMQNYSHGLTMVHELGHCLGLYHPFSGGSCTDSMTRFIHSQTPQSPIQANPNYGGEVFLSNLLNGGTNALDNAGRDYLRLQNPGCASASCGLKPGDTAASSAYSCLSQNELANQNGAWECPFNIMDYADDTTMLGFLSFNTSTMRNALVNNENLFHVSYGAIVPQSNALPSVTPAPDSNASGEEVADSDLSTTNIIIIAVCSVVGAVLVVLLIVYLVKRGQRVKASTSTLKKLKVAPYKTYAVSALNSEL